MNDLRFSCPGCGQNIECDASYAGAEISCPTCATGITAPEGESTESRASSPVGLNIDASRRALQGFEEHYSTEIEPFLQTRREQQRAARMRLYQLGGLCAALVIVVFWVWAYSSIGSRLPLIVLSLFLVAASFLLCRAYTALVALRSAIKGFLLLEVCRYFGFDYSEECDVDESPYEAIEKSGLLPYHDRVHLEDHISGTHDGIEFGLCECRLKEVIEPDDDDTLPRGGIRDVYHGLLFRFAFPKKFRGRTVAMSERGAIGNALNSPGGGLERVELEDPRFEKLFAVWGDDQIEARYLLTPTFMERVVALSESINSKKMEFGFSDANLLISAHVKTDQFEGGGMFADVTDKRRVEQLLNEISRVFDVIDTLKLTLKSRI